ncbi:MAG: TIGR02186 family protein, partial [Alphaproteobacteria bacterium]|nr:TIGR02186 family protein [Alphaproteobacteria bacterium]
MKPRLAWLGFALAFLALVPAATAANLVSGLSQDQIEITSNYTGTDLVVFGAIESRGGESADSPRDVVVVVRGPDIDMNIRKKERVAGLWINRHEVTLFGMPGYYYL